MRALLVSFFLGCMAALVAISCKTTETGRRSLALLPESQVQALGSEAYEEISAKEKLWSEPERVAEIIGIAERVAAASNAKFVWEFKVFENDQINAFCLPGGKIGIYSGLLPIARTNAGLAAVIGHEIAHATLQHGNERMTQGILLKLGLQASDLALSDSNLRQPILAALGLGAQFGAALPFGRYQETEADRLGLRYMAQAGYDPSEAAGVWKRMAGLQGQTGSQAPEWLSTHPDPSRREIDLKNLASDLKTRFPLSVETKILTGIE